MISLADLEIAYNALLSGHAPVSSSGQANDAFEVYALGLVLRAARDERASIQFESVMSAGVPSTLKFRTTPGRIYSTAHDYSHAVIQFPDGLQFEGHIGVFVQGAAGVLHECDVLVIDRGEGQFCRRNRVHPKRSGAVVTAECKFYTGKLGIELGRQFLGVTADLGTSGRFLLSNSDGKSVDRVLAHHGRDRFFKLSPLNADSEAQAVSLFRSQFRDLRAKRR